MKREREVTDVRRNRLMGTAWVLLLLVLVSTWWVCGLYARYTVSSSGEDSARIAAFAFFTQDHGDSRYLDLSGIEKPGDSRTYTFTVSNQKGNTVSEVAEEVKLAVQLNGSMPLVCTISGEKGEKVLSANLSQDTQELPVKQAGSAGVFPAATVKTYTYTITVEWPEDANDMKYASRSAVAEVLLTVTAEQVN